MDLSNLLTLPNLGIGTAIAGAIAIAVGIMNYFSPERVKSRMRLERADLVKEKAEIEAYQPTPKSAARLLVIEKRIKEIDDYFSSQ